jgi:hypothetical protein
MKYHACSFRVYALTNFTLGGVVTLYRYTLSVTPSDVLNEYQRRE